MKAKNTTEINNLSRRNFVGLASKASAKYATGVSTPEVRTISPMQRSDRSFDGAGTLAAKEIQSQLQRPNIDEYRQRAGDILPKLSTIVFNRLAYGPTEAEISAFELLGDTDEERLEAWVDTQLDPDSVDDADCNSRIAATGFLTTGYDLEYAWSEYRRGGDYSYRRLPMDELEHLTFLRAAHSKKQLFEVLTEFWHNHFNIYGWSGNIESVFMHWDEQVIRKNVLGNFRQFIEDVGRHPAMLYYLDNYTNTSAGFNENYARELFELHTMGSENYYGVTDRDSIPTYNDGTPRGYVDADVYDAAECFTGWTVDDSSYYGDDKGTFIYRNENHSQGEKRILKDVIPAFGAEQDGVDVYDRLAVHPGTARYISRKLCRRLIMDHPPESLVKKVADVFLANTDAPDQLLKVAKAVIMSEEFRTTWGEKVKRPYEVAVSAFRATGSAWDFDPQFRDTQRLMDYMSSAGQRLFAHPTPDGYSDFKENWVSTNPLMSDWRLILYVVEESHEDVRHLRIEETTPNEVRSANELVDYWSQRVLGKILPEGERKPIVDFMANGRNPDMNTLWYADSNVGRRLRYLVGLILISPTNFLR